MPKNNQTTKLSDDARRLRAEYQREWRKKNKDKMKRYNDAYWERKAKAIQSETDTETDIKTDIETGNESDICSYEVGGELV